jgi:hypothetical protein
MSQLDSIVFGKKKFSDILKKFTLTKTEKKKQVTALISELKPLISDIGDATLVVPLIKEYMEIGVKNDEQLIKMATIFNVPSKLKPLKVIFLYLMKKKNNYYQLWKNFNKINLRKNNGSKDWDIAFII